MGCAPPSKADGSERGRWEPAEVFVRGNGGGASVEIGFVSVGTSGELMTVDENDGNGDGEGDRVSMGLDGALTWLGEVVVSGESLSVCLKDTGK